MTTQPTVVTTPVRFHNWVFCNPNAVNGRATVIQINSEAILALTETGRFIFACCKAGEIGQEWVNGEFQGQVTGIAYAFLGESGSVEFAGEIGATKVCPTNRFELCPDLPHHQFSYEGLVEAYPGLKQSLMKGLDKGDFSWAQQLLNIMKEIADFARSKAAWHYMDLP